MIIVSSTFIFWVVRQTDLMQFLVSSTLRLDIEASVETSKHQFIISKCGKVEDKSTYTVKKKD